MKLIDSYSDQEFKTIITNSATYSDVRRAIGYSLNGMYANTLIEQRMKSLNIKFGKTSIYGSKIINKTNEDIFKDDSTYLCTDHLKQKIIKQNLLPYQCSLCNNNGTWNGRPLSLQIHHINGKRTDNRLQNLCFLCPNCHSQTDNFSGRGQRRAKQDQK